MASPAADSSEKLALKVFPYEQNQPSFQFINEARFFELSHENVIRVVDIQLDRVVGKFFNNF